MTTPINNTLNYRVSQLEKNQESLGKDIKLILVNHLPHLSASIQTLRGDIKAIRTEVRAFAVVNVATLIIGIIVAKMFL